MSQWKPCKRRDFIRRLRKLGFEGPYSGTRHQFMIYGQHRMAIPSNAEYSVMFYTLNALYLFVKIGDEVSILYNPVFIKFLFSFELCFQG